MTSGRYHKDNAANGPVIASAPNVPITTGRFHSSTAAFAAVRACGRRSPPMLIMPRRGLLAAAVGLIAAGRVPRSRTAAADDGAFPADFVWGASTASYQIEGAVDEDGRGKSIWDVFSHTPGRVKNGDTGDIACDHYHRWRDDIDLLARGNFSAYRFSTAWSRILPSGGGAVEQRGVEFGERLVDGLIATGVGPWLCLYHWDLPQALQEKGGWLNRDTSATFADYARVVARRIGARVKHWAIFNEPNVHALFGHGTGEHAPGLKGLPNMLAAIHHLNLAQGRAVQALRAERADLRLGTVISLQPARPSSDNADDRRAAERFDAMWNGACLDPLMTGAYPAPIAADFAALAADRALATSRPPRARPRCKTARLFRLVAARQLRMGGRLQPPLRRGSRRFHDAQAHAQGVLSMARAIHKKSNAQKLICGMCAFSGCHSG